MYNIVVVLAYICKDSAAHGQDEAAYHTTSDIQTFSKLSSHVASRCMMSHAAFKDSVASNVLLCTLVHHQLSLWCSALLKSTDGYNCCLNI